MNLNPIQESPESPGSTPSTSSNSSTASLSQPAQSTTLSNSLPTFSSSGLGFNLQSFLSPTVTTVPTSATSSSSPKIDRNPSWSSTIIQQTQINQPSSTSLYRASPPSLLTRNNSGGVNSSSSSTSTSFFAQASPYIDRNNTASSLFSGYSSSTTSINAFHEKSLSTGSIPAIIKDAASSSSQPLYSPTPTASGHRSFPFDPRVVTSETEKTEPKDNLGQRDGWQTLCTNVLPLFNGEGLKMCIEDLNDLLRRCINDKTPESLYYEINELLASGMSTLNSKLRDVPDEKLVSRLNELWSFYFGTVIPYFEGVFLPLQIQSASQLLSSNLAGEEVSIRRMVLMSFRDQVILPMGDRVDEAFNKLFHDFDSGIPVADTAARMLQMTYILSSILSNDDKQKEMDKILAKLKNNW
ncbi:hypothetical protein G9A89_012800 [Geosiphon pyriformis]|nr:hypothetical protein G9A89_012800 [Geosiphon pyriformis]